MLELVTECSLKIFHFSFKIYQVKKEQEFFTKTDLINWFEKKKNDLLEAKSKVTDKCNNRYWLYFLVCSGTVYVSEHLMNYHCCQFSLQTSFPKNCDSCEKCDNEVV